MKRAIYIAALILTLILIGCRESTDEDSPVVPMPSPPIMKMFPIEVDLDTLPDGFVDAPTTIDNVDVVGTNALVVGGEVFLAPGSLTVESPEPFRQAAVLVQENSGMSDTIIEGLAADDELLIMATTGAPGNYYYVRILGSDNVIKKIRVDGINARVKKLILARPFFDVDFSSGSDISADFAVGEMLVSDFDDDGNNDLAAADMADNSLRVSYGDGVGGFFDSADMNADSIVIDLENADMDNDGLDDLLALGMFVNVFTNLGSTFDAGLSYAPGGVAVDMAVGLLDDDAFVDVAVAAVDGIYVLDNDGTGGLEAPQLLVAGDVRAVAVADMTGDGIDDIVCAYAGPDEVEVLEGDGMGGFTSIGTYALLSSPVSLNLSRFDWDDFPDVALLTEGSSPNFQTFINRGDGVLVSNQAFQATVGRGVAVTMSDINDDGFDDMAIIGADNQQLAVFTSDLVGNFIIADRIALDGIPTAIGSGDMDDDGRVDILTATAEGGMTLHANRSK